MDAGDGLLGIEAGEQVSGGRRGGEALGGQQLD